MADIFSSSLMRSANQIPTVLIYTDASYDPDMKRGAWACYIRYNNTISKYEKLIERPIVNSTQAERSGVAAALWIADNKHDLKGKRVILNCDNMAATRPVKQQNKTGKKKQAARGEQLFYQRHIEPFYQVAHTVEVRYVKSHMNRTNRMKVRTRHHLQDDCDKRAGKVLSEHRKTVEKDIKENGI